MASASDAMDAAVAVANRIDAVEQLQTQMSLQLTGIAQQLQLLGGGGGAGVGGTGEGGAGGGGAGGGGAGGGGAGGGGGGGAGGGGASQRRRIDTSLFGETALRRVSGPAPLLAESVERFLPLEPTERLPGE
ncbi:hypothetical protein DAPPUDRAFT_261097 [Daphnia pulex]|uniref:Uncharacterized protein n=1 Tax=Daphnia pulex TaxID=6669 RepID=E9HKJ2_DAPPU|nr:hypothetical protein DAPPUDRAFT_261097 [Daphnia pulex]|eukprot:EFX67729.1 hypothetical protein DAPPUDRAFT_261097 [Daphnia pulex]